MAVRHESPTRLAVEIRIVPTWAWVLAVIGMICAPIAFTIALGRHHNAPPVFVRPVLGLLLGLVLGCYLLLIGYINRDAKRRGMSPVLWTIVAIFIPNTLGIILYFLLRQPLQNTCPQCGSPIQAGFSFCPRCSYKLGVSCPQCQRVVGPDDVYCPYCGTSLRAPAAPGPETKLSS